MQVCYCKGQPFSLPIRSCMYDCLSGLLSNDVIFGYSPLFKWASSFLGCIKALGASSV